jgi:excisionase family DNA binding protein
VTDSPRFIDVDAVAKELAISRAQVYSLLRGGDLPAIQVGPKRVWRIERAKLEEYIERQYQATREAIERGDVPPPSEDDQG